MGSDMLALYISAAAIGWFHTVLGPDHYLPFVVISRARNWSLAKTALITLLCGFGHIMSSVILGAIGIILGIEVMKLEALEAWRGNLAAWALIAFGLVYFVWGLQRVLRNQPHRHRHLHGDLAGHTHIHAHTEEHLHVHAEQGSRKITPWVLFTIFVLGPCEPLIPILMYPAARNSLTGVIGVCVVFGTVTISTMVGLVLISSLGIKLMPLKALERYTHALAGMSIFLCGLAIQFLGL